MISCMVGHLWAWQADFTVELSLPRESTLGICCCQLVPIRSALFREVMSLTLLFSTLLLGLLLGAGHCCFQLLYFIFQSLHFIAALALLGSPAVLLLASGEVLGTKLGL